MASDNCLAFAGQHHQDGISKFASLPEELLKTIFNGDPRSLVAVSSCNSQMKALLASCLEEARETREDALSWLAEVEFVYYYFQETEASDVDGFEDVSTGHWGVHLPRVGYLMTHPLFGWGGGVPFTAPLGSVLEFTSPSDFAERERPAVAEWNKEIGKDNPSRRITKLYWRFPLTCFPDSHVRWWMQQLWECPQIVGLEGGGMSVEDLDRRNYIQSLLTFGPGEGLPGDHEIKVGVGFVSGDCAYVNYSGKDGGNPGTFVERFPVCTKGYVQEGIEIIQGITGKPVSELSCEKSLRVWCSAPACFCRDYVQPYDESDNITMNFDDPEDREFLDLFVSELAARYYRAQLEAGMWPPRITITEIERLDAHVATLRARWKGAANSGN